jgi:hypothetical protein
MTFFTPFEKYDSRLSVVRNLPLHSSTMSTCPVDQWHLARLRRTAERNRFAIDRNLIASRLDALIPAAMHGVECKQVSGGLGSTSDLVHMDELQIRASPASAQGEAPHPAQAVDSDSGRHESPCEKVRATCA